MITKCTMVLLVGSITWYSCEEQQIEIPDGALKEHTVDLAGTWKVKRVLLNNVDITSVFNFDQISLTLMMDQAPTDFTIETGTAPFPVRTAGKWQYNDLAYPTSMQFEAQSEKYSVSFAAPPISGDTSFKISFSLGCRDNLYTYYFEKE
ncbi:MAG: DUF5004 domain-containing protein [Saprospiraceae bacterium]|nr:DUF5004 domain-containing protein [Saprospiraceae bacterium]